MAAHVHLTLLLLYAADAKEINEPWTRWEYKSDTGEWRKLRRTPVWDPELQYRRVLPPGQDVRRKAVKDPLQHGEPFFSPDLSSNSLFVHNRWYDGEYNRNLLARGLVFLTEGDAITCARSLLSGYLGNITAVPTTSHKHADRMLEYAELAKYMTSPWLAFESKLAGEQHEAWSPLIAPTLWITSSEYRLRDHINREDFPKAAKSPPVVGVTFYRPSISVHQDYITGVWTGSRNDMFLLESGQVYNNKHDAITHTELLLYLTRRV